MKTRRIISLIMAVIIAFSSAAALSASAALFGKSDSELYADLENIYRKYNFTVGWGLYDVSGSSLYTVASKNTNMLFQSNCTIKAMLGLYVATLIDNGTLSRSQKVNVNRDIMHYGGIDSGTYTVNYLLDNMITVTNSGCYEALLRLVGYENFNAFLASIGSGTRINSYSFMGKCTPADRATEWFAIYKYCHSNAATAKLLWYYFVTAKYSFIRDGLILRPVAHKSGWYEKGSHGYANDCAIVQSVHGGCYLFVLFTMNNGGSGYSQDLVTEMTRTIDKIWNNYQSSAGTYAPFLSL